ncbi:hypothetical protein ANFP_15000 [Acidithiobacillus ferrooxidans]|nr:hypothetical protein ANFP_15000 [Acidithiobacillus ferrooxidans]
MLHDQFPDFFHPGYPRYPAGGKNHFGKPHIGNGGAHYGFLLPKMTDIQRLRAGAVRTLFREDSIIVNGQLQDG